MAALAAIWRHPVKGVGAEPMRQADLSPDRALPGDRSWAILTGSARDTGAWQPCRNFARGAHAPQLMAVTAETRGDRLAFAHPQRPELEIDPTTEGRALVDWIAPLWPAERPVPHALIRAPKRGMADSDFPSVSILGLASLDVLSKAAGRPLDPRRFRGNLWLDGLEPWEEFEFVGRTLRIGETELEVVERIERCRATEASPDTGERDTNTLALLRDHWGHRDFGVMARVVRPGRITLGSEVQA